QRGEIETFYISDHNFFTRFALPGNSEMPQIQTRSGKNFLIQSNAASRSSAEPPRISYFISRVRTNRASPKPSSTSTCSRSGKKLCMAEILFPGVGQKRSNALNTEYCGHLGLTL